MTTSPTRFRMAISLGDANRTPAPTVDGMRPPVPTDAPGLARLMLRAYRGTVDDAGEGEEEALAEVARLLDGAYGRFLGECSRIVVRDDVPISAALLTLHGDRPLVAFSMTDPDHKRRGLARACLVAALDALRHAGHREAALVVTSTNAPAIGLYEELGFTVEATRPAAEGTTQR